MQRLLFKTIFVASVFFPELSAHCWKIEGTRFTTLEAYSIYKLLSPKRKTFSTSFISEDLSKVHWFLLFGYGTLKKMFNKKHNSHLKHFTKLEISVELFLGFYYRLQLVAKGSVIHSKFPISILRLDRLVGRYNVLSLE